MNRKNTGSKALALGGAGVILQSLGGICILAASVLAVKDVNQKLREAVFQELAGRQKIQ